MNGGLAIMMILLRDTLLFVGLKINFHVTHGSSKK